MQLSHPVHKVSTRFDEENLLPDAGLVPVMALAQRAGLDAAIADRLTVAGGAGTNPVAKVTTVVAGMAAGADSIDDLAVLGHGATPSVLSETRAPSTIGTFLRAFTFGHVRQLDAIAATTLAGLARMTDLLPDVERIAYLDIDDTVKQTYGYAKQGAAYGYSGVKGLNALVATLSTPTSVPVIIGTRLRKGNAASAHGAGKHAADAIAAAKRLGAIGPCAGPLGRPGTLLVRTDSAYYGEAVVAAARRAGARFSVTARMNPQVKAAITRIDEGAWQSIRYPNAIWDQEGECWISHAEVAEIDHVAFTSKPKTRQVTARLIVRRVKRPADARTHDDQGEIISAYRYHAVFTDSPFQLLDAEADHRRHAIVEQVIADLKNGALAHLPSGNFTANAAWLALAAITHNLLRAAGVVAGGACAKARTGTIRDRLVKIPARIARSARRLTLHLPARWRWQNGYEHLADLAALTTAGPVAAVP